MCVFCSKTREDFFVQRNNMAALYNISPILPGHCLIIPKRHVDSVFELSDEELASFMRLGRDVARLLSRIFDTDAFNWAIQEKRASGQSVDHLHMHVVPRKIGDLKNPGDWYQALEMNGADGVDTYKRYKLSEKQLSDLTRQMKEQADIILSNE
jgi:bis(5'-adenosyl)-triphosphatase